MKIVNKMKPVNFVLESCKQVSNNWKQLQIYIFLLVFDTYIDTYKRGGVSRPPPSLQMRYWSVTAATVEDFTSRSLTYRTVTLLRFLSGHEIRKDRFYRPGAPRFPIRGNDRRPRPRRLDMHVTTSE